MNGSSEAAAESRGHGSKTISVILLCIGSVALCTSMWMNAKFGWGLSPDLPDRIALAIHHVLVDPAAASLVATSSLMIRWGRRRGGWTCRIFAVLLMFFSMLNVFGFISASIAMTQSRDAIVLMQQVQLDWTRNTSINRELPKYERRLLRNDARELSREIHASHSTIAHLYQRSRTSSPHSREGQV